MNQSNATQLELARDLAVMNKPTTKSGRKRNRGMFPPGVSGNPTGRPRVSPEIRQAYREHAPWAIATLLCLTFGGYPPSVRERAARTLLDRGYGGAVAADLKSLGVMSPEEACAKVNELQGDFRSVLPVDLAATYMPRQYDPIAFVPPSVRLATRIEASPKQNKIEQLF